jgi:hypothetical protein
MMPRRAAWRAGAGMSPSDAPVWLFVVPWLAATTVRSGDLLPHGVGKWGAGW